jgi:hypothetical protein
MSSNIDGISYTYDVEVNISEHIDKLLEYPDLPIDSLKKFEIINSSYEIVNDFIAKSANNLQQVKKHLSLLKISENYSPHTVLHYLRDCLNTSNSSKIVEISPIKNVEIPSIPQLWSYENNILTLDVQIQTKYAEIYNYTGPKSVYIPKEDLVILKSNKVKYVTIYDQNGVEILTNCHINKINPVEIHSKNGRGWAVGILASFIISIILIIIIILVIYVYRRYKKS